MRFEDKFDFKVQVSEKIDKSLEIPPMIIQPHIENAVNHGIYHLVDKKGRIEVDFTQTLSGIKCTVLDNGIGREASSQLRRPNHRSRGTEILNERMTTINKSGDVFIESSIKDLFKDEVAIGTRVEINFDHKEYLYN